MGTILRETADAASRQYDLIVVGGGIHGVMILFEAVARGLRPLLLERDDFGQHTSFNSLRVIHGGLRYLQKLDIARFRESVAEQAWFLKTFPNLVKPLPCLIPLYGEGLRRPSVFRIALMIDHALSLNRNRGVSHGNSLPRGKVISSAATEKIFPAVLTDSLQGGAIWFDAYMPQSQRLLIEILKYACHGGATALNYLEVTRLRQCRGKVDGVGAVDRESGKHYDFKSEIVVNATGPWCRRLAQNFLKDEPDLFKPSLAWNILLNQTPLSEYALAVRSPADGKQTYFLIPWKGKLLIGTGHAPWPDAGIDSPVVSSEHVEKFLDDVNRALPGLYADRSNIDYVLSGFLPVRNPGSTKLTSRGVILHHGDIGGPEGFYSVSGIKFTTARRVAQKLLDRIPLKNRIRDIEKKTRRSAEAIDSYDAFADLTTNSITNKDDPIWKEQLKKIVQEEAVQHLDDVIFRRSDIWEEAGYALEIAPQICDLIGWDEYRRKQELQRLSAFFDRVTTT